jgi:hypothetical protein
VRTSGSDESVNPAATVVTDDSNPRSQQGTASPQFPRLADLSACAVADAAADQLDTTTELPSPSLQAQQSRQPTEAVELLDLLDDAVFDAIAGKAEAVEQLRALWPLAVEQLASDLLVESKDHYVRQALANWRQCREGETTLDAARGIAVLDLLSVILGE